MPAFDLKAEAQKLIREGAWTPEGRITRVLAKYSNFRVVLIVMKAGALYAEHQTTARITVHTIFGHLRMNASEQTFDLPAGHLLDLDSSVPHDVRALEESAFLLTLAWPEGTQPS